MITVWTAFEMVNHVYVKLLEAVLKWALVDCCTSWNIVYDKIRVFFKEFPNCWIEEILVES